MSRVLIVAAALGSLGAGAGGGFFLDWPTDASESGVAAVPAEAETEAPAEKHPVELAIAECAGIGAEEHRLGCFDTLARQAGLAPEADAAHGKWEVVRSPNPLEDKDTVALRLVADRGTSREGRPVVLVARCMSGRTDLYIRWGQYLGDDAGGLVRAEKEVVTRVGDGQSEAYLWPVATESHATFVPENAEAWLRRMAEADSFVAQLVPHGATRITAIFDTAGLAEVLPSLSEACTWDALAADRTAKPPVRG